MGLVTRAAALLPDRAFAGAVALTHPRFEPELRRVVDACDPDGTAVDVGAWYGPWSYWLSRRCRHVVAFEPAPTVAAVLGRVAPENVSVHAVAVSDHDGDHLTLARSGRARGEEGRSTLAPPDQEPGRDDVLVPARRLDSFGLRAVRLVKVDVEGHERAVLDGAVALLERDHPVLVVELEERHGTVAPVMELLADLDYRPSVLLDGEWAAIGPEELAVRQRRALAEAPDRGYLATALHASGRYPNNVVFTHPAATWDPTTA